MGEFDLIKRYFRRPEDQARGAVALGIGDDCALLNAGDGPPGGQHWAVSTDMLVEGRHFLSTVPPERLGHKSLAVNLSDLAACGAQPQAFTLSLSMPRVDEAWLEGFSKGLFELADAQGIVLAGGDTTAGPLTIGITVLGTVPPHAALRRSAAQLHDDIWVSHPVGGGIGDARLALEVFRGRVSVQGSTFDALRLAMECPQPRVSLGMALRGLAHAAIDLSDGLVGDLGHVLKASSVGAELHWPALPRSPVLAAQSQHWQESCLLHGGDDYELLFTAPPSQAQAVQHAALGCGVAVSRIGRIMGSGGIKLLDEQGREMSLSGGGFDHFLPSSP